MPATATDRLAGLTTSVAVKPPCDAVTSFDIPLTGLFTVNTVALQEGDRVLVIAQTDATQNGIYNASTSDWSRALDFDGARDVVTGTLILVRNGVADGAIFEVTTLGDIEIGTTPIQIRLRDDPTIVYAQTSDEISAGVVPVLFTYPPGDVRRYGALLDGITDGTAAMVLACLVGGRIDLHGPLALSSAALALLPNKGIGLVSGSTIRGYSGSVLTVTGSTACNVFYSTDVSDVEFVDVSCTGNGVADSTTGYFWYIKCSSSATKDSTNLRFLRGGLTNFKGLYWIYVDNTAATTFSNSTGEVAFARFISKAGNSQNPTDISITASVLGFSGSDTVTGFYTVKDWKIHDCYADGTFIKNFLYFWSGTLRCKAYNNTLVGFGLDSGFSNDTGAYALAAYDHAHGAALAPEQIEFINNTINGVRDCGIYLAAADRVTVNSNRISNQTSTSNGTLPKGGIASNGAVYLTCIGNTLDNCAIGMSLLQSSAGTVGQGYTRAMQNMIEAVPTNGIGLILSGTSGGNAPDMAIDGIKVVAASGATGVKCIHIIATATVGFNNLEITNFDLTAGANGIDVFAPDSSVPNFGNIRIANGKIRKMSANYLQMPNCTNAAQRVCLQNIDFFDMASGAVGLFIQSMLGVTVRGLTFHDLTTGSTFCWNADGAQGRVSNVQFNNVAAARRFDSGANQLAVNDPTGVFTGNGSDFIQNLNVSEQGSASSKYVVLGWTWDSVGSAWKACRALTGN